MGDRLRERLQALYREVGADASGRLPADGSHVLSTGEALPFVLTELEHPTRNAESADLPGQPPFRRGVFPTMYRGRLWTMRQYAGFGTAEETNRRFRFLLDRGQTGLSMAFDLPTQMGFDPDDPMAAGEVGRVGVSISTVDDLARVFEGIPLDRVSVSMTINATAPILMGMLAVVAEERGLAPAALTGTVQNDILKEYMARGAYIYPPRASLALCADLIAWCSRVMPRWNPISISGYHIRESGADAIQEVGLTLADGLAYVRAAMDRGLEVDAFAPRLSFFFGCHNHFLEEVAKFRAARVAWATLMRDRMGAKDPRSMALRFHTQTSGCTLTAQQPENNVVRVAVQALAAVLGGTQSLHTNALDEALSLPSEETARLALRTQQVLAAETHVADFVDPLGGSYVIEALTDRILRGALTLVDQIEDLGGMVKAIERGWPQKHIERSAYRQQRALDTGAQKVVGVNWQREDACECGRSGAMFPGPRPCPGNARPDAAMERRQRESVRQTRERRDPDRVRQALDAVRERAAGSTGVVEAVVEAVRCRATLGEVSAALESVHGRYRPGGLAR